jgi:hypothetical protein
MILGTNVLLLTDVIYSLIYFRYNYLIEIKKRFSTYSGASAEYKDKVLTEVSDEIGLTRHFVNSIFFVWIIVSLFTGGVLYPLLVMSFNTLINLFNKQVLLHPIYFLLSLLFTLSVHLFVLLDLFHVI